MLPVYPIAMEVIGWPSKKPTVSRWSSSSRLLKRLFGFKSSEIQVTTASLTIGPASRSANNPSVKEPQDATLTARHNDEGNDRPT